MSQLIKINLVQFATNNNTNSKVFIMKALVKKHTKEGIWLEDVPMPEVGNNDVF